MNYENILKNTLGEFIIYTDSIVDNVKLSGIKSGFDLFGIDVFFETIIHNISIMIRDGDTLIKNHDETFFTMPFDFFNVIELQLWYPTLDDYEKKIIWKFIKTIVYLFNKIN